MKYFIAGAPTSSVPHPPTESTSTENPTAPLLGLPNLATLAGSLPVPPLAGLANLNSTDRLGLENELLQNPDILRQFFNNPIIQGIVSDPENIRMFMSSNPQMRDLIEVSTFQDRFIA